MSSSNNDAALSKSVKGSRIKNSQSFKVKSIVPAFKANSSVDSDPNAPIQ